MEDSSGNQMMARVVPSPSQEKEGCATEPGRRGEVGRAGGHVGPWGTPLPLVPFTASHHLGCPLFWAGGSLTPYTYPSGIHRFCLVMSWCLL